MATAPRVNGTAAAAAAAKAAAAVASGRSATQPTDKEPAAGTREQAKEGTTRRVSIAREAHQVLLLSEASRALAELQRERGEKGRDLLVQEEAEGGAVATRLTGHPEEDEDAKRAEQDGGEEEDTKEDDQEEAERSRLLCSGRESRSVIDKEERAERYENIRAVHLLRQSYRRQKQQPQCQEVAPWVDSLGNSKTVKKTRQGRREHPKKQSRLFRLSCVASAAAGHSVASYSPVPYAPVPPTFSCAAPPSSPSSSSSSASSSSLSYLPSSPHPTRRHRDSSSPSTSPSSPCATSTQLSSYSSSSASSSSVSTRPSSSASPARPSSSSSSSSSASSSSSSSSSVSLRVVSPAPSSPASSPPSSCRPPPPAAPPPSPSAALLRFAPASSSSSSLPAFPPAFPRLSAVPSSLTSSDSPSAASPSSAAPSCVRWWRGQRGKWSAAGAARFCGGVGMWYASSLLLTASNKYLFDVLGLPLPISVTFLHFSFVSLALQLLVCCFPRLLLPCAPIPRAAAFTLLLPAAACAAADIALTNSSYSLLPISAITLVKSSSVFFTYLLSVLCRLESFRMETLATLVLIVVSICLTVPEMEMKSSIGVVVVSAAVLTGALRWICIQRMLRQYRNLSVPHLLLLLQPLSSICLSPAVLFYELPPLLTARIPDGGVAVAPVDCQRLLAAVLVAAGSVLTAALVLFAEVTVLDQTSSVSLCVAGVGKEVLTISMSVVIFGEILPARVLVGIVASILGVLYYAYIRYKLASEEVRPV